ncbi:hypothetical protein IW261DRAFT_1317886, partial [Armillaria novae-zelandiae]
LLHWGLFGALSVQLYLYYLAFPKDKKFTKYLVYGIYIIEFVQTVLFTHDAFAEFGYGFGDIEALTAMDFNWLTVSIMCAVVACIGQVFYAYRIFILSKSRIVPLFVTCVRFWRVPSPWPSNSSLYTGVPDQFCGSYGSALCDIIIAICMTYYLRRSNTSFRRTRIMVSILIRLTIETGTMTAVVVLLNLILFLAFPHQTFYAATSLVIPQLYANAILMMLNSRIRIVGGR